MAFLGLLTYFFFLYIRPQDWVPGFVGVPVDLIVYPLVLIAGILGKSPKSAGAVLKMPHFRIMVLWVIGVLLSNLSHGDTAMAAGTMYSYVRFAVIFFTFALVVDDFEKLKRLILFMVLLTAVLAVEGIDQKIHGIGWAGQGLGWGQRIKWVGLWDGMNVLCLLFVISVPFLLQFIFGPWKGLVRLVAVVSAPLIVTAIYLTNSRGGFMSLLVVVFLHFKSRIKSKWGLIFGMALVCLLIVAAPSRFGDFHDKDNSASYRVDMWTEAFEMVHYNPLFGIGKGQFLSYTSKLIAHNSFLEVMGETGLFGLMSWLALLYVSVKSLRACRPLIQDPRHRSLADGLLIALAGYIITSFFVTAEFELLYVLLALSMTVVRLSGYTVRFGFRDFKNVAFFQLAGMAVFFTITRVYFKVF